MTKQLIINADDFGRTRGINDGILHAHRKGCLSSTSALTGMPYISEGLQQAATKAPDLGIGVHLNVSQEQPLLPAGQVPTLVDHTGKFIEFHKEPARLADIRPEQLHAEWHAQIERFYALGSEPDHLDSHQHIAYMSLENFQVFLSLAQEFNLPIRFPPDEYLQRMGETAARALVKEYRIKAPESCIITFFRDGVTREHLLSIFATLPEGTHELMCHPARVDQELIGTSTYAHERKVELDLLTDPEILGALDASGIELASFQVFA